MKYRISQTFETLGGPGAVLRETRAEANDEAAAQRSEIATMVAEMSVDASDAETGYSAEIEAWREARRMAGDSPTYGVEAGAYIAEQAVEIEEIED